MDNARKGSKQDLMELANFWTDVSFQFYLARLARQQGHDHADGTRTPQVGFTLRLLWASQFVTSTCNPCEWCFSNRERHGKN